MVEKSSKRKRHPLGIDSKVNALAVKCYDEQFPYGVDKTMEAVKNADKSTVHILAIRHDRNIVTDGIWTNPLEKPHYHFLIRYVDRKTKVRVSTVFNQLHIFFRPTVDDSLWLNHGVETIGEFTSYAVYLTHDTEEAVLDGKEPYSITEIISNLSLDEIKQVRDGYTRITDASNKVKMSELANLDEDAFKFGYELGNFTSWYHAQPFSVRSNAKMRTIKESYYRGVESRLEESRKINRLCIYIMGEPNTGKTYAAEKALDGKRILSIGGGGTGKFDKLRPDHEAIIIDDDVCPNLLNMTDNYMCHAYRRNSDNPVWAGQYFIVTSNLGFTSWLISCGIKVDLHGTIGFKMSVYKHYEAMVSRFYLCCLIPDERGGNKLALINASTRGSAEEQLERYSMFRDFKEKFNNIISSYLPTATKLDYSTVLDTKAAGCLQVEIW